MKKRIWTMKSRRTGTRTIQRIKEDLLNQILSLKMMIRKEQGELAKWARIQKKEEESKQGELAKRARVEKKEESKQEERVG